jgi:hypothetical protein
MRYTSFAFAALMLVACSNDEREPSLVSEAQAAVPQQQKDYGWRATPDFSAPQKDAVEYY